MENKEYYFDYLKQTDRFPQSVYHRAKHDMVRRMLDTLPAGASVLDAGCGVGHVTGRYCDRFRVVGVDEQLSAVQCCSACYDGRYVQGGLYSVPFRDGSFDLVLFLDAIEHLTEPVAALEELARVLKPGCQALICTMNYDSPLWFVLEHTWHRFFGGPCKPYSLDVHPTPYGEALLRSHCAGVFDEVVLEKRIMKMELFCIARKG